MRRGIVAQCLAPKLFTRGLVRMLLQTNSYVVPKDKRMEHARLLRRFRQVLLRLGCDHFEVFEQVGANWSSNESTGRFVQIMRFRDRKHQLAIQTAERNDPTAQSLLREFCELINLPYQQQQGLFAVGFYTSFLRMPQRTDTGGVSGPAVAEPPPQDEPGPQPEAPESSQSVPMPPVAEESASAAEPGQLELNAESDAQAAKPSDPPESQSEYLPPDNDDESTEPSNPGEPASGQDENAPAQNPSPFNS